MRHGAQQIRAHRLALGLRAQPLLLFDLGVHRADDERHRQHRQKGQRIAGEPEVERPEWIGEHEVHADHAEKRAENAPEIALRKAGDDHHRQHEDQQREAAVLVDTAQHKADRRGDTEQQRGEYRVTQVDRYASPHFFGPLSDPAQQVLHSKLPSGHPL